MCNIAAFSIREQDSRGAILLEILMKLGLSV